MLIYILILPACSLECDTFKFDNFYNNSNFQYFTGDFVPPSADDHSINNRSMKILEPTPEHPKIVSTSVVIDGDYGTLEFRWRKEGADSGFSNLIFEIDGTPYICTENPFYKRINKNENNSHNLKWILEDDNRTHIGTPKSNAYIDEFILCGLHFNGTSPKPKPIQPNVPPYITPTNGSLNDTYTYTISRKDVPDCSEPLLEIKNPHTNRWQPFGKGKWNLEDFEKPN